MSEARMWIVEHADGSMTQHHDKPGTAGIAIGVRRARVPRRIDFGVERWDWSKRRIVAVPEGAAARIDAQHAAAHGAGAIATAHAAKAIEARLILAGLEIEGLLAAEARATGQDVVELARMVDAKAAEAETHEINRIAAKRAARTQRN